MFAVTGIVGKVGGEVARTLGCEVVEADINDAAALTVAVRDADRGFLLVPSQRMKNPLPRIRMLDGFNEWWIEFERGEAGSRKGNVLLKTVLRRLIEEV